MIIGLLFFPKYICIKQWLQLLSKRISLFVWRSGAIRRRQWYLHVAFFSPSKEELNKHLDQHRGLTFQPGLVGKGLFWTGWQISIVQSNRTGQRQSITASLSNKRATSLCSLKNDGQFIHIRTVSFICVTSQPNGRDGPKWAGQDSGHCSSATVAARVL